MNGLLIVNEFLYSDKFNEIHDWLINAAVKHGITLHLKTNAEVVIDINEAAESVYGNKRLGDFILFWDKDVKLASYLEHLGYPVFNNSKAIETCDDKALTHLALMKQGIRMPRTILAPKTFDNIGYTNYNFLREAAERLNFPMVVKECFGSFGQQVYLVGNYDELLAKVRQIGTKPMLFQEFIKSSHGRDIRLQVVGDRVIAGMYRYSDQGDFRANLTIGGRMQSYEPTQEQRELAIRCCQVIGLDFAGVDLLFHEKEVPVVCEINSNAHFKNIYDCTGVNAADAILEYITERLKSYNHRLD